MNAGELAVSLAGLLLANCADGRGSALRLDVLAGGTLAFSTDAPSPWPAGPAAPGPLALLLGESEAWLVQDREGERRSQAGARLQAEALRPGESARVSVRAAGPEGTAALQSPSVLADLRALAARHLAVRFRVVLSGDVVPRRRQV